MKKQKIIAIHKMPEYPVWSGMITRCENPNVKIFPYYGGRGIKVCPRWRASFLDFLSDMGVRPSSKHSLDRFPNREGDYERHIILAVPSML